GSLHEAVEERIAHAGEQTAELLAQGAVLGAGFSLDDVAALSGLGVEDCARRAGRALRAGLLVARGDSFRFANDIVRQVAYEAALELARDESDSELEARALEQLGWTALYARDAMHAVDFAEQATELAESAAAAPGALPSATLLLGRVRHWDGEYAGAEAAYNR